MNTLYNAARKRLILGTMNWVAGDFRAVAVDSTFVFDATHITFGQTTPGADIGTSDLLINKDASDNGYASGSGAKFPNLYATRTATAVVLVQDLGTGLANALLVAYIDTAVNLPFAPDGNDWYVLPDFSLDNGWFRA